MYLHFYCNTESVKGFQCETGIRDVEREVTDFTSSIIIVIVGAVYILYINIFLNVII